MILVFKFRPQHNFSESQSGKYTERRNIFIGEQEGKGAMKDGEVSYKLCNLQTRLRTAPLADTLITYTK